MLSSVLGIRLLWMSDQKDTLRETARRQRNRDRKDKGRRGGRKRGGRGRGGEEGGEGRGALGKSSMSPPFTSLSSSSISIASPPTGVGGRGGLVEEGRGAGEEREEAAKGSVSIASMGSN